MRRCWLILTELADAIYYTVDMVVSVTAKTSRLLDLWWRIDFESNITQGNSFHYIGFMNLILAHKDSWERDSNDSISLPCVVIPFPHADQNERVNVILCVSSRNNRICSRCCSARCSVVHRHRTGQNYASGAQVPKLWGAPRGELLVLWEASCL
jgi:hypothetical protein